MSRRECPSCQSGDIRPAQFRLTDILGYTLFCHPCRCRECKHRFWRFRSKLFRKVALVGGSLIFGGILIYVLLAGTKE